MSLETEVSPSPGGEYRPIRQLGETLVNQIAAGEVVERPASAVKELVENSLDAGATQITIAVWEGGTKEIRVIDNGGGIAPEDMELATRRHATSKITSEDDLEAIATFGFRGEALSSLASVAELEVRSRRPHAALGSLLKVSYGAPSPLVSVGASPGTTMIVRDLFARLPARQKFLRSAATEFTHIAKVVKELALANPHVEFSLLHNDRPVLKFLVKPLAERFTDVVKPEWEPDVVDERSEFGGVTAFLSPIAFTQGRGELFLFVNRRPVKNRTLLSAIRNAFTTVLGPEREPSGAVYLDVRFDWIDVNVHPQKWEVRCFQQERLYAWLLATLRKHAGQRLTAQPALGPKSATAEPSAPLPGFEAEWQRRPEKTDRRYLGTVGRGWHLAEDSDGLLLFDPHAIAERRAAIAPIRLPVAKIAPFPTRLMATVENGRTRLIELGFEAEPFGDGDVALKAYPSVVTESEAWELFVAVTTALEADGDGAPHTTDAFFRKFFQSPEGQRFALPEPVMGSEAARGIVEGWGPVVEGDTCPHGRPFLFRMSWDFVGKQFERGK